MSPYFALRMGKSVALGRFPKVSVVCDTESHLFLSAQITRGPRHDMCEGPTILRQAARRLRPRRPRPCLRRGVGRERSLSVYLPRGSSR
jgi:hypothetical protein